MAWIELLRRFNFTVTGPHAREHAAGKTKYSTSAKIGLWSAGILAFLVVLAVVVAFFIDEPLRRRMESNLNNVLTGYTVRIGKLDFHPIGLSLDLEDSTIIQNEHPEPPVAYIPNLTASVDWLSVLRGKIVAEFDRQSKD